MLVRGNQIEILRQGTDWEDWRLGIQLAINGQVKTMFDLHKSIIETTGDGTPAYEELLYKTANSLSPSLPGVPPAPAR